MRFKYISVLLVAAAFSTNAEWQEGEISGYVPYSVGDKELIIFKLKDNVIKGCNVTGRFSIDDSSQRYKSTLTAIMSAYHAKSTIKVNYSESCNAWSNSFDANYICVGDINC